MSSSHIKSDFQWLSVTEWAVSPSYQRAFSQDVQLLVQLNPCPLHDVRVTVTTRSPCRPESSLLGSANKYYTCGAEGKHFSRCWMCDCKSKTPFLDMTWSCPHICETLSLKLLPSFVPVPAAGRELEVDFPKTVHDWMVVLSTVEVRFLWHIIS